jgi:hypothetical protein
MIKHGIDQETLITRFEQASAQQGDALRKAVSEATLKALQGRELTLSNIRQVLGTVAKAASTGAAASALPQADVEGLLAKAFAGMDAALAQTVHAHRKALQQLVDQGASLRETPLKKALSDVEKMEDSLFAAVRKAAADAGPALEGSWAVALQALQGKGTATRTVASATIEQFLDSAQDGLKQTRAAGLRASQALVDSYAALVSGVLIGLSDALHPRAAATAPSRSRKA